MVLAKLANHMQKIGNKFHFLTLHKNQLKMIKDLEVRLETLQLLSEGISIMLQHIGTGNNFLNKPQRHK